jgi:hypothetical protein
MGRRDKLKSKNIFKAGIIGMALALLALSACKLETATPTVVTFDSKKADYYYSTTDSSGNELSLLAFTIVYDSAGKASARFDMTYDADGNILTTNVWEYADDGSLSQVGYYVYDYETVTLSDGSPYKRIIKGTAYDANDVATRTMKEYYTVEYSTLYPRYYTRIADYSYDGISAFYVSAEHRVSWQADGIYNTEQYFSRSSSTGPLELTVEYAAYYDANSYITRELCHFVRSSADSATNVLPTGKDEGYFYTRYSITDENYAYRQTDYWYGTSSTSLPNMTGYQDTTLNCYANNFTYTLLETNIQGEISSITTEYNSDYNIVKKQLFSYGNLDQVETYTWQDKDHIRDVSNYSSGGTVLQQRDSTTWSAITLDGVSYTVATKTTYYGDSTASSTKASASAERVKRNTVFKGDSAAGMEIEPQASSTSGLIKAYEDKIFKQARKQR